MTLLISQCVNHKKVQELEKVKTRKQIELKHKFTPRVLNSYEIVLAKRRIKVPYQRFNEEAEMVVQKA